MSPLHALSRRSVLALAALALILNEAAPAADPPVGKTAAELGLQIAPDTTVVTGPLDADGYPDFLAALRERLSAGVTREENFWVLMWPAIGNAERTNERYLAEIERELGVTISREPRLKDPVAMAGLKYGTPEGEKLSEQQSQASSRPWSREEFPEIAKWVDANEQVLVEVHAACQRPKAYAPLVAGAEGRPMLIAVLLPHVQAMRAVSRVLAARAMLRLQEGDVDGAWSDLLDMHRIAAHTERGFSLIESLVGYAIRAISAQPMAHWITRCGLPADELQARLAELTPLQSSRSLARAIDCERLMYVDSVVTLMAGRANSSDAIGMIGGFPPELDQLRSAREMMFQLLFLGSDVNETLRYGNQMYDDLVAALEPQSHQERAERLKVIEQRVQHDAAQVRGTGALVKAYFLSSRAELRSMPGRVLTSLLMPAMMNVETVQTRIEARSQLVRAAFAVQIHLLRHGKLPLTVAELDPAPGGWTDPFNGEPLRMKIDDRGLVIYSIGPNGKDDGGIEKQSADDPQIVLTIAP